MILSVPAITVAVTIFCVPLLSRIFAGTSFGAVKFNPNKFHSTGVLFNTQAFATFEPATGLPDSIETYAHKNGKKKSGFYDGTGGVWRKSEGKHQDRYAGKNHCKDQLKHARKSFGANYV